MSVRCAIIMPVAKITVPFFYLSDLELVNDRMFTIIPFSCGKLDPVEVHCPYIVKAAANIEPFSEKIYNKSTSFSYIQ